MSAADETTAGANDPIYGHMLIVSVGGGIDAASFDRLMRAAIESSAWFAVSDQRISDIAIDAGHESLRECAADEVNDDGLLELVLAAPTTDETRSVESTCRRLGLPYRRKLEALDLHLKDEIETWLPGMDAPVAATEEASITIPPFEARF